MSSSSNQKRRHEDIDEATLKEEAAMETILAKAGVHEGLNEIAKVVYCFWYLGQGWQSLAELSRVYSTQWPHVGDSAISRIRDGVILLNEQINDSGMGSLPQHGSNCTQSLIHAICNRRSEGTYALEPYLSALVSQACGWSHPSTPKCRLRSLPSKGNDKKPGTMSKYATRGDMKQLIRVVEKQKEALEALRKDFESLQQTLRAAEVLAWMPNGHSF